SKALQEREASHRRLAQAESLIDQAQEAQRQLGALEPELAVCQRLLSESAFAPQARNQLGQLERQIVALGYDAGRHAALRGRAAELAGVDSERQLLEQARLSAEHLDAQI